MHGHVSYTADQDPIWYVTGVLLWLVRGWNSLPAPLRDNSIYIFRKLLKTHLFIGACRA